MSLRASAAGNGASRRIYVVATLCVNVRSVLKIIRVLPLTAVMRKEPLSMTLCMLSSAIPVTTYRAPEGLMMRLLVSRTSRTG